MGVLRSARTKRFVDWAATGGFRAEGRAIDFVRWKHLRPIYESVPLTLDELLAWSLCIMAASQGGKSVVALLLSIYLPLRFEPFRHGYYLPTATKATDFSDNRWLSMVRDNPGIHALLGDPEDPHARTTVDEGAMSIRKLWRSLVYFFSLEGKISTESNQLDSLTFDEVHAMSLAQMEKAHERVSASDYKITTYVSTGGFEGGDIDYWFGLSDQRWFHTTCGCRDGVVLARCLDAQTGPTCIDTSRVESRPSSTPKGEPYYVCPTCGTVLADPQVGRYVAHRADVHRRVGFQFPQLLSPMQTPREILHKWTRRVSVQNFYNRVYGRPYTDPTTVPINDQVLEAVQNRDLLWGVPAKTEVESIFMGVDQRPHELHVVVKGRVGDRLRLLWVEVIQGAEAAIWGRIRELLREYRVRFACIEHLPNGDAPQTLATEFPGKVFVVTSYGDIRDAVLRWNDHQGETSTERRTADEFRTPYTVHVDRYKMMSIALHRFVKGAIETPDARTLVQRGVRTREGIRDLVVCQDMFWRHLKSVALVTELVGGEKKADELKYRALVKKIGPEDPHLAFANMLCDVAVARAYNTTLFINDDLSATEADAMRPKSPTTPVEQVAQQLGLATALPTTTCGDCLQFDREKAYCTVRFLYTQASAVSCEDQFIPNEEDA